MTSIRLGLLCLVTLGMMISPARAAIDKAGADKLKTVVGNFITEQKKLSELNGHTKIDYQGETTVEQAGDYYAVTLPYIKVMNPDGTQTDIGMISINATPGDSDDQWKMRVAVPTPIIVTDKSGKEITRITLGGQRAAGIWDESLRSFIKLDALYKDISISGIDGTLKIPETTILYNFTKDAAGKWSGPGTVTVKNIDADFKNGLSRIKAAEVRADFTVDQYDSSAIRAYREKLAALSETINNDTPAKGAPSPNHTAAIANTMADFITAAGNGMKFRYTVKGLNVSRGAMPGIPAQDLSIPNGFFGMDLTGFSKDKARAQLQLGYDGLVVTPVPEGGLTPTNANVDLTLENIPLRDIIDLGRNTVDASLKNPELAKMAGGLFVGKMLMLMSQSGSALTVTDTHIGNADIDLRAEGNAKADISAVTSATADMKFSVRGLETLIARLKDRAKTMKGDSSRMNATIQRFETFRDIAKVETANGQPVHVVKLQLTPQGQTLANGQDLKTLLLNGTGARPAAAVPVAPVGKSKAIP